MTSASISETVNAASTTIGRTLMKSPICPLMNNRGANAAIVVITVTQTGQVTSSVPLIAASFAGNPSST